jgi:F-type H+-transporting ATPase subunit b
MKKIILILFLLSLFAMPLLAEDAEHEAPIDNAYWYSQLVKAVNFGLIAVGFFFLWKKVISKALDKRGKQIDVDLQAAARARDEAEKRLQDVAEEVARLEDTVAEIKIIAVSESESEKERIINQAKEEAERIINNASLEVDNRIKSGRQDLKAYAAEEAIAKAREILQRELGDAEDKEIIGKTIVSIGDGR